MRISADIWLSVDTGVRLWGGSVPVDCPISNEEYSSGRWKGILKDAINHRAEQIADGTGDVFSVGIQQVLLWHDGDRFTNLDIPYIDFLAAQ